MSRARLIAAALLLGAAAAVIVLVNSGPGPYIVRAQFRDAAGLRANFYVKIGGVPVGKVTGVRLGPHDMAIATLAIDRGSGPVGRDASATIRPSNLLGEKYVDLHPGTLARPAASGTLIPRARTATPTELDDLIDTFDPQTRLALGIFLSEQGNAVVGRGADLAQTLSAMPQALDQTRQLVTDLAHDNVALGDLIERSDRIVAASAAKRADLGRLVAAASGTLGTLASRQAQLGATIRNAPAAVEQIRSSLEHIQSSAAPLAAAARGLRATAPPLTATLHALPPFAAAAAPAMKTLEQTAPALQALGRRATPVVRRLRPTATQLDRFSTTLDPVTKTLDAGIGDALGLMEGWARAIQNRDAAGHVYRVGLVLGDGVIRSLMRDYISPSTTQRAARRRPSKQPGIKLRNPKPPSLNVPSPTAPNLPVPPVPPVKAPPVPSNAVLDYLLKP